MRGRTIYYLNRRILVFCGHKKKEPHSVNDVFGTAKCNFPASENIEGIKVNSDLAESKKNLLVSINSNNSFLTQNSYFSESDESLSFEDKAAAYTNIVRFGSNKKGIAVDNQTSAKWSQSHIGSADSDILAKHESKAIPTGSFLANRKDEIILSDSAETIKTQIPVLTNETANAIFKSKIKRFKTSNNVQGGIDNNISIRHSASAYNEEPTRIISAGKYSSRTDITNFEPMQINIPISYMDDVGGEVTASLLEVKYMYILGTYDWVLLADSQIIGIHYGNQWLFIFSESESTFTVMQDTTVTLTQFNLFYRYFRLVSYN